MGSWRRLSCSGVGLRKEEKAFPYQPPFLTVGQLLCATPLADPHPLLLL